MADQENNETIQDAPDAAAETPASEPEAVAEEAAPEAAPDAEAAEEPAPEAAAAEEPAAEAATEAPAAPAAPSAPQAPPATPKERKAAARVRRGKRRGATPEQRAELRAQKAKARSRRRASEKAKRTAATGTGTPPAEHGPGAPKTRTGKVVSDKADKTITVRIEVARRHRRYQKIIRSSSTLHAHDEANDAHEGDLVRVVEARPTSRTKRWRLVEVLERAK
jgi:small subunit ribosomal protein S17